MAPNKTKKKRAAREKKKRAAKKDDKKAQCWHTPFMQARPLPSLLAESKGFVVPLRRTAKNQFAPIPLQQFLDEQVLLGTVSRFNIETPELMLKGWPIWVYAEFFANADFTVTVIGDPNTKFHKAHLYVSDINLSLLIKQISNANPKEMEVSEQLLEMPVSSSTIVNTEHFTRCVTVYMELKGYLLQIYNWSPQTNDKKEESSSEADEEDDDHE